MTCGAEPQAETLASKSDPLVSSVDEDWHPPMLAEDKPSQRALVAKNMSAPAAPVTPAETTAVKTKSIAHVGVTPERDGVEVELGLHKTRTTTVLDAGGQVGAQQLGPHAAVFHKQLDGKVAGIDLSLSTDAGTVEYGPGIKNADGSKGIHVGGNATTVGFEATAHEAGQGSVTVGAGGGLSAEASIGVKKEGNTTEACARVSALWFTVGACFPVWTSRN